MTTQKSVSAISAANSASRRPRSSAAGLYEQHDRGHFTSTGFDQRLERRQRAAPTAPGKILLDAFTDISRACSDQAAAEKSAGSRTIDIPGQSQRLFRRPFAWAVFARRPAPIQVN